jgi:hypothetical protein
LGKSFSIFYRKNFPDYFGEKVSTSDKNNSGVFSRKKVSYLFSRKMFDILFEIKVSNIFRKKVSDLFSKKI